MECIVCGNSAQDHGMTFTSSSGDVWGACNACRADAALGRAVRRMPVDAYLLRVAGGWQADAGMVPDIAEGDTLDAVLQAAGLMEALTAYENPTKSKEKRKSISRHEPLEKEISVEDIQKIVDANEKLVKELKDYEHCKF